MAFNCTARTYDMAIDQVAADEGAMCSGRGIGRFFDCTDFDVRHSAC
jgi:hypothetical protein